MVDVSGMGDDPGVPVLTPARLRSITAAGVAAAFVVGTGAVVFLSRPDPPTDLGTAVVVVPRASLEPTTAPSDAAATAPSEEPPVDSSPPVAEPAPAPGPVAPAPGGRVDRDDDDDDDFDDGDDDDGDDDDDD